MSTNRYFWYENIQSFGNNNECFTDYVCSGDSYKVQQEFHFCLPHLSHISTCTTQQNWSICLIMVHSGIYCSFQSRNPTALSFPFGSFMAKIALHWNSSSRTTAWPSFLSALKSEGQNNNHIRVRIGQLGSVWFLDRTCYKGTIWEF